MPVKLQTKCLQVQEEGENRSGDRENGRSARVLMHDEGNYGE